VWVSIFHPVTGCCIRRCLSWYSSVIKYNTKTLTFTRFPITIR
jgi:hypothetical protein